MSDEEMDAEDRVREIRNQRNAIGDDAFPPVGDFPSIEDHADRSGLSDRGNGVLPETSPVTTGPHVEIEHPNLVLVCSDCRDYYEHNAEWEVCPKCGADLLEVEKA